MGREEARSPTALGAEESAFLISLLCRFDTGVSEGHLHTLVYVGQALGRILPKYGFQFREMVPFSEDLDMSIALLLWQNRIQIRDNRICVAREWGRTLAPAAALAASPVSLDKLLALSYDALKVLAAMLHVEQDLQKSRKEALRLAARLFPIREEQALDLMLGCSV